MCNTISGSRFKSTQIRHCVIQQVGPYVLKYCTSFIFRVKQSENVCRGQQACYTKTTQMSVVREDGQPIGVGVSTASTLDPNNGDRAQYNVEAHCQPETNVG